MNVEEGDWVDQTIQGQEQDCATGIRDGCETRSMIRMRIICGQDLSLVRFDPTFTPLEYGSRVKGVSVRVVAGARSSHILKRFALL